MYWIRNPIEYNSPYYEETDLESLQLRVLEDLNQPIIPIDPTVYDLIIDINKLPFVVHTVEYCSGHIDCPTGLPKPIENSLKYYWYSINSAFLDTSNYDEDSFLEFMEPQYQLASYFFTYTYAKRLKKPSKVKKKRILYRKEFSETLLALGKDTEKAYYGFCSEQDPKYTSYDLDDYEDNYDFIELFRTIATTFYERNHELPIFDQLQRIKDRIVVFDDLRYCDWAWGSSNEGPFLDIIYIQSPNSHAFHNQLSKLFAGSNDNVTIREEEDIEALESMIKGGPDAICVACFDLVAECSCVEEGVFDEGYDPTKELAELEKIHQHQFQAAYWKSFKRVTIKTLDTFWRKVRDLVELHSLN